MERRKRKLISNWAQLLIAVEVVLHALLLVALISLFLFAEPFMTMFSDYSADDHTAIAKELFHLNASKWPLFILLAIFTGFVSVLFSHHIVGPIQQLTHVLKDLGDRKLSAKVKFRKSDYLMEIETQLNTAISRWKEDITLLKTQINRLKESLDRFRFSPKQKEKAEEIQETIASMNQVLRMYEDMEKDHSSSSAK